MGEEKRHVTVAVINGVEFLAVHEASKVVLDDWALGDGGVLSSSSLALNAVAHSEDVFIS